MPVALIVALAASLGLHAAALFGPDIDLAPEPEMPPLVAELRPLPPEPPPAPPEQASRETQRKPERAPSPSRRAPSRSRAAPTQSEVPMPAPPVIAAPEPEAPAPREAVAPDSLAQTPQASEEVTATVSRERLPPRGTIRYRVDRGDSGFEIGMARQDWEFDGDRYRLSSAAETTGLAWLIHSVSMEMESLGRFTGSGLQPEVFGVTREGRRGRERALFDWEAMRVRIGDRREHQLEAGTQDLLSVFYQLGFIEIAPGGVLEMPLATGKKYAVFRVENLGDEVVDIPLGALRARHLRLPGDNTTEVWLAYDYRLLPVKIRHINNKGDVHVQVATEILFGQ